MLGNEYWTFNLLAKNHLFETLKMFHLRMDGWDGQNIKSVLQFSLYFVCISIMYITTYICSQNLSPTFLWVLKFDVNLVIVIKKYKVTAGRCFFIFSI